MFKKMNLLSTLLLLQLSVGQAQVFEVKDQNTVDINVTALKKMTKNVADDQLVRIAKYLTFIKLSPDKANYKVVVSRLLGASTQFLLCDNVENIACIESKPLIAPSAAMRVDAAENLGVPVKAGKKLDIDYYFTEGWYTNFIKKQKPYIIPEKTVAMKLAGEISNPKVNSVWMAVYGIDDIEGSMSSVFNAVKAKVQKNIPVRAVVDVSDSPLPNSFIRDYDLVKKGNAYQVENMPDLIDYSYIQPARRANWAFGAPLWTEEFLKEAEKATAQMKPMEAKNFVKTKMLSVDPEFDPKLNPKAALDDATWLTVNKKSDTAASTVTRISYQYAATMDFMRLLNTNIKTNDGAMAHIEYPYSGIMHNKFVVFESADKQKAVWTGTANVARTCMGSEENANMSIMIKNDLVAQAFLGEFNEMFTPLAHANPNNDTLVTGAFHNKKRPNTKRYFVFDDGTQVRVHFSPTDDAEHKVVLPLIYSARKGDELRISMFGSGGFELVRAMQAAVARGVKIRIAVDSLSGAGRGSWVKSTDASLFDKNPYVEKPAGSVEVRANQWKGLNHHKTATLTRRLSTGKMRIETLVIGSQNWSAGGNDLNDENVVTITNKKKALDIMLAYNKEFDEKIWTASAPIDPTAPVAEGAEGEEP